MIYYEGLRFLGWDNLAQYPDWNDREHMEYYALQFNYSGPLQYAFSQARDERSVYRVIDAPCVWMNAPGYRYLYGTTAGNHRWHRWVSFEGSRMAKYIEGGLIGKGLASEPVLINRPDQLANEFDRLFELLGEHQQDAAVHCLEGIFLMIQSQPEDLPEQTIRARIDVLARNILMTPGNQWDFEEQAVRLSVSYPHFRRVFRERIQNSPGKFLQKARLEYAAELLRRTSCTLSEVAFQSGFLDTNYFSRLFSRRYQLSPSRYRKVSVEAAPAGEESR